MAAASSLVAYEGGSDESDAGDGVEESLALHLKPLQPPQQKTALVLNAAPEVATKEEVDTGKHLDPSCREVMFNPTYETLFAPEVGPVNPFRTKQMSAERNSLAGFTEAAHFSDFMFEQQRRTFTSYGYALDPSVDLVDPAAERFVGAVDQAEKLKGITVFESMKKRPGDRRRRQREDDPSNVESYLGPWAKFVDERPVAKPSLKELDEITAKRQKRGRREEEAAVEEKTILH
ncbi:pre-mRNA-processing factor 17-like, partial [Petromyzon marinus]|uniref:pre-mRNA-processing factor 17-like n=1 Tax=Petromyzon marinus TaxID=7757 RepID=UPI003F6F65CD